MADMSKYQWTLPGGAVVNHGGMIESIHLDTSVLEKITNEIRPRASRVIENYGNMITSSAIKFAPVDTGALINSISAESKMTGELTFTLRDGVEYGIFQELGTRKMAAHPFVIPAIEMWREKFLAAFAKIFEP